MKPKQLSRATLQRKIRRLEDLLIRESALRHHEETERQKDIDFSDERAAVISAIAQFQISHLRQDNTRLSNLLQAYKDQETDKAHRIIRKNP